MTDVTVTGTTGGGLGSTNHCMHGEDAVIEEILDWRPYDYLTDRTIFDHPSGPVKILHTIELEPDDAGTTIHFRFGAPKTKRGAVMEEFAPTYAEGFRSSLGRLTGELDAALAAREADGGVEPELPEPRPDGPLSGLEPPVIRPAALGT